MAIYILTWDIVSYSSEQTFFRYSTTAFCISCRPKTLSSIQGSLFDCSKLPTIQAPLFDHPKPPMRLLNTEKIEKNRGKTQALPCASTPILQKF